MSQAADFTGRPGLQALSASPRARASGTPTPSPSPSPSPARARGFRPCLPTPIRPCTGAASPPTRKHQAVRRHAHRPSQTDATNDRDQSSDSEVGGDGQTRDVDGLLRRAPGLRLRRRARARSSRRRPGPGAACRRGRARRGDRPSARRRWTGSTASRPSSCLAIDRSRTVLVLENRLISFFCSSRRSNKTCQQICVADIEKFTFNQLKIRTNCRDERWPGPGRLTAWRVSVWIRTRHRHVRALVFVLG